ncbi:MAG: swr1 complex component [Trichoglossum hirsutum]|nr:MAG: swr1 complex component [Trichoglossum hirsutum]
MRSRSRSGVSNNNSHENGVKQGVYRYVLNWPDSHWELTELGHESAEKASKPEIHDDREEQNDGGPPSKKRKLTDIPSPQQSSSRHISPPWKRVAVEGPTSFVEGGRRKSSRTNAVPLELQPPSEKRQTRAAVQKTYVPKTRYGGGALKRAGSPAVLSPGQSVNGKRSQPSGKMSGQVSSKSPAKSSVSKTTPSKTNPAKSPPSKLRRLSNNTNTQTKSPHNTRRSGRVSEIPAAAGKSQGKKNVHVSEWESEDDMEVDPNVRTPVLKFKVKMPKQTITNPGHVLPLKWYSSFKEWLEHDDPLSIEEGGRMTGEGAKKEAKLRMRILEATEPGGILSEGRCSLYVPDAQEEPPQQYSHQDHLLAHALRFRSLMNQERKAHANAAKRLAYAAATEWRRRQPKSKDEILQEQFEASLARYKQLRKDVQAKWDMVKAEVNRRRLAIWEEEQEVLGKKALNEMLEHSTQLLDARRTRSELPSEDEESDSGGSSGSAEGVSGSREDEDEDEDNMSTSVSESESSVQSTGLDDDEGLTVEELRRKYAALTDADQAGAENGKISDQGAQKAETKGRLAFAGMVDAGIAGGNLDVEVGETEIAEVELEEVDDTLMDDSDESTDMASDMGDSDEGETDEGGDDGESEDEGGGGLLGFYSKAELVTKPGAKSEAEDSVASDDDSIIEEDDLDEVSLIPDNSLAPTPFIREVDDSLEPELGARKSLKNSVTEHTHDELQTNGVPSSQASPNTNETTKPSEIDSASSVELHPGSQHPSSATTPQPSYQIKTPIPFLLRGTLREYQHYGLDWLAGLYRNRTNGILADEMGLGKTIQTIALLAHLACEHEVWGPHLIIVPTSVMLNWEMEFKKWCPGFKILTYYGTQEERKQKRRGWLDDNMWHVCITSYQLVLQDNQTFKRRNWHYMILDEAHNIKNFRSQRWQTLLTFKTRARLLLTGTPLQNNLTELWSLLFFLMPSDSTESGIPGFADLKEFSDWFRRPVEQILEHGRDTMDDEAKDIVAKLHRVLRPYLLRRLKADVEKQMPLKYEHVVYCRLSKRQRYLYDGFMSLGQTRETLASGNYLSIINCLMQLRKVCNHPDLFETRQIVTSFAMNKSAVADYEIKELLVRKRLLQEDPMTKVNLGFLNLTPAANEGISLISAKETSKFVAIRPMQDICNRQLARIDWRMKLDASSVQSTFAFVENKARKSRLEDLRHCVYLNALRSQKRPVYGSGLIELLTLDTRERPLQQRPRRRAQLLEWLSASSHVMKGMVLTLAERSKVLEATIQKFACITPAVVATDMIPLALTRGGVSVVREAQQVCKEDAFHEARVRLSIAFPDKRLLQYDCGKLQQLDKLLRELQAGGHRALIFTQMTKVLDILEQFLNIHGHRYLRLDGATKIEQRQILTDRFNNDTRILAFILSSRSGGLGINLTGADTVIFYDLDWNPAMDKQCQDRCHRIGQTRDVHIYRFVSEYTIESNILRKANQKRMLDDVVIQEGEFTTDYFNKLSIRDMLGDDAVAMDGDASANAAMDRVFGGPTGSGRDVEKVLEQVEDREDIVAAKVAEKELIHTDDADFDEKGTRASSVAVTPAASTPLELLHPGRSNTPSALKVVEPASVETTTPAQQDTEIPDGDGDDNEPGHVDEYMLRFSEWELKDTPVILPPDRVKNKTKKNKKGTAHRVKARV